MAFCDKELISSPWPPYNYGFGNEFATEALPGALPKHNNPHRCPYSLHAEQISGTAFTAPRHKNKRTWMYRIRPSAMQGPVVPDEDIAPFITEPDHITPERIRWKPFDVTHDSSPNLGNNFVQGLITIAGNGDPSEKDGKSYRKIFIVSCSQFLGSIAPLYNLSNLGMCYGWGFILW